MWSPNSQHKGRADVSTGPFVLNTQRNDYIVTPSLSAPGPSLFFLLFPVSAAQPRSWCCPAMPHPHAEMASGPGSCACLCWNNQCRRPSPVVLNFLSGYSEVAYSIEAPQYAIMHVRPSSWGKRWLRDPSTALLLIRHVSKGCSARGTSPAMQH